MPVLENVCDRTVSDLRLLLHAVPSTDLMIGKWVQLGQDIGQLSKTTGRSVGLSSRASVVMHRPGLWTARIGGSTSANPALIPFLCIRNSTQWLSFPVIQYCP